MGWSRGLVHRWTFARVAASRCRSTCASPFAVKRKPRPERGDRADGQILWCGVTAHPTAEWIANQLTEACGWEQIPRYLIRDRDMAHTVKYSCVGFDPSVFEIARPLLAHP